MTQPSPDDLNAMKGVPWREVWRITIMVSVLLIAIGTILKYARQWGFAAYRALSRAASKDAYKKLDDTADAVGRVQETLAEHGLLLAEVPKLTHAIESATVSMERIAEGMAALSAKVDTISVSQGEMRGAVNVLLAQRGVPGGALPSLSPEPSRSIL